MEILSIGKVEEQLELSYSCGGNKLVQLLLKNCSSLPIEIKPMLTVQSNNFSPRDVSKGREGLCPLSET